MIQKEKRKNSARNWLLLYVTIALLIGGVIGFALGLVLPARDTQVIMVTSQPYPTPTPIAFVEVTIAFQSTPCGTLIEPRMIALIPYMADIAPITLTRMLEDVIGKYATVDIPREMPILSGMLADSANQVPASCPSN